MKIAIDLDGLNASDLLKEFREHVATRRIDSGKPVSVAPPTLMPFAGVLPYSPPLGKWE